MNKDTIASFFIHHDGREAGCGMIVDHNIAGVDSFSLVIVKRLGCESNSADAADHGHRGTESSRHDGLVSPLASETELERIGGEGFARLRESRSAKCEID